MRLKMMTNKLKVINFFGGPGAGKSTTASGVFYKMKMSGFKVEFVSEYPKELTYEESWISLENQLAIFSEQYRRLWRLQNQVDYVIMDTSLMLGWLYAKGPFKEPWFLNTLLSGYNHFDNLNVFLKRKKEYMKYGRKQTEEEAKEKDVEAKNMLDVLNLPYYEFDGDENAVEKIFEIVNKIDGNENA